MEACVLVCDQGIIEVIWTPWTEDDWRTISHVIVTHCGDDDDDVDDDDCFARVAYDMASIATEQFQ